MSSIGSPSPFFFGGKKAYEIDRSLRFNRDDNAYLTRTPSSAGNRKTMTFSAWFKLGQNGVNSTLNNGNGLFLSCGAGSSAANMTLRVTNSGYVGIDYYGIGGYYSTARLRDPSAWYHIVWVIDTTQSTSTNRFKVYVNNELYLSSDLGQSLNADTPLNNNSATTIGAYSYNTSHGYRLDGYLAEVHFLDGYAYDPTYFAETNTTTGQWNPKEYTGSYGSNGFYLNFSDTSSLGADSSGNSNNFTPNNFSVAAGQGNDSVSDSPTNNFCTINPLVGRGGNYLTNTNGNLDFTITVSSTYPKPVSTFNIPTSGKWYSEWVFTTVGSGVVGVGNVNTAENSGSDQLNGINYLYTGEIRINDSTSQGSLTALNNNDIVGVKVDSDAGTVAFTINGSAVGNAENISSMATPTDLVFWAYRNAGGGTDPVGFVNFGQRPFSNLPSGYKALCSANLSDPTILLPNKHFDTLLYTANGGTQNITGLNFNPDWVWGKSRSAGHSHDLYDTVRGDNLRIFSDLTNAEATGYLQFGVTGGFSLTAGGNINDGTDSVVAWNWKAGGTASSNSDGTITSSVSANTTAGFSIATYTGNGTVGATIGHGLGVKPDAIIIKCRNVADNWIVYHKGLNSGVNPEDYYLFLNTTNAQADSPIMLNDTAPTSSVITLQNDSTNNLNGRTYVMYAFSEVSSFSKFGFYTGNGSSNGTFVFTGFRPAFVMVKRINSTGNWVIVDNKRDTFNVCDALLSADISDSEYDIDAEDLLSNGFKMRDTHSTRNASGGTYIYLAFAESPFKYARAR